VIYAYAVSPERGEEAIRRFEAMLDGIDYDRERRRAVAMAMGSYN
jgi:hypothetical protein